MGTRGRTRVASALEGLLSRGGGAASSALASPSLVAPATSPAALRALEFSTSAAAAATATDPEGTRDAGAGLQGAGDVGVDDVGGLTVPKKRRRAAKPRERKAPITVTARAATQLEALLSDQPDALGVRLGVRRRGCNGLSYTLNYAEELDGTEEEARHRRPSAESGGGGIVGCPPAFSSRLAGAPPLRRRPPCRARSRVTAPSRAARVPRTRPPDAVASARAIIRRAPAVARSVSDETAPPPPPSGCARRHDTAATPLARGVRR